MKVNLFDTFAGIGALHKALTNIGVDVNLIGYSENNVYADLCYQAIHNVSPDLNFGDITTLNPYTIPDFDIMNFSFPCKDFSVAGKMKGLKDEGGNTTHSGLYYYGKEIIKIKQPKYIITENVKGITLKKFSSDFDKILQDLNDLGYNNYYNVINSKYHGVPQNRERLIMISVRKDIDTYDFIFPEKRNITLAISDILDKDVADKYYCNDLQIYEFNKNIKSHSLITHKTSVMVKVRKHEVNIKALQTLLRQHKQKIKATNKEIAKLLNQPITLVEHWFRTDKSFSIPSDTIWFELKDVLEIKTNEFDKAIMEFEIRACNFDKTNRVYDVRGIAPTLTATSPDEKILLTNGKIRKLTPKETWLLMGYAENDFIKAKTNLQSKIVNISNEKLDAELYERAGRSIVVPMLEDILRNLFN